MRAAKCNLCKTPTSEWVSVPIFGGICIPCFKTEMDFKLRESFFRKGRALGVANIRSDAIVFHFRDDIYNLPTSILRTVARYNRRHAIYTAPVAKLKRVAEKVIR